MTMLVFLRTFIQDFIGVKGRDTPNLLAKPGITMMRKVNSLSSMRLQPYSEKQMFEKTPYYLPERHRAPPAVKDVVADIETEFPSAGNTDRSTVFKKLFLHYSNDRERTNEEAAEKALEVIKRQNEGSLVIRKTLDSFSKESSNVFSFLAQLTVETETKFESLPKVQCLEDELSEESQKVCPKPIVSQLASSGVIKKSFPPSEALYWRTRIPSYLFEKEATAEESISESDRSFSSSFVSSSSSKINFSKISKLSSYTQLFKKTPGHSPPEVQL
jgi:hypothetical protein